SKAVANGIHDGIDRYAKVFVKLRRRCRGSETLYANVDTVGTKPARPAEGARRFDTDRQASGAHHLVAVVWWLLKEEFPARHGDYRYGNAFLSQLLLRL